MQAPALALNGILGRPPEPGMHTLRSSPTMTLFRPLASMAWICSSRSSRSSDALQMRSELSLHGDGPQHARSHLSDVGLLLRLPQQLIRVQHRGLVGHLLLLARILVVQLSLLGVTVVPAMTATIACAATIGGVRVPRSYD